MSAGLLACTALLAGCRSQREESIQKPVAAPPPRARPVAVVPPVDPDSTDSARAVRYASADSTLAATSDSILAMSCSASSHFGLSKILRCAEIARRAKIALQNRTECDLYSGGCDTSSSVPLEDSVHRMLLAWQMARANEPMPLRHWPRIIRDDPQEESISGVDGTVARRKLPRVPPSTVLAGRRFLFLGAGPFLVQERSENDEGFPSPDGGREWRYSLQVGANTDSVLDALASFPGLRYDVRFGPAVSSYDSGPQSIRKIGSLDHVLRGTAAAYFLTRRGVVAGRLVSVVRKILTEDLCVRDQATVVLATPKPPSDEILAVLVPLDPLPLDSVVVEWNRRLWTADLDRDGIPEFAGVIDTFAGIADDALSDIRWYVNILGDWKMIDAARDLDCT